MTMIPIFDGEGKPAGYIAPHCIWKLVPSTRNDQSGMWVAHMIDMCGGGKFFIRTDDAKRLLPDDATE